MNIPSFDFQLFSLPNFSPLQAQEYGADTSFNANTPSWYVDFSLNQLLGLMQPSNPSPYVQRQFPARIQKYDPLNLFAQKPDIIEVYPQGTLPPELQGKGQQPEIPNKGCNWFDIITLRCNPSLGTGGAQGTGPIIGSEERKSDGENVLGKEPSGAGKKFADFLKSLPTGSGIFLIAIIALIFLLLFARR